MFEDIFRRRKLNIGKLLSYGFDAKTEFWEYNTPILNADFMLYVSVMKDGSIDTNLIERDTQELYVLYKTDAVWLFLFYHKKDFIYTKIFTGSMQQR